MMRILASSSPGEVRVAALEGDTLTDYAVWRPGAPDGLGDIYRARITARVPAMAGAFVALPGGDGFLPDSEGAAGRTPGELVSVHVTRTAQGGKGPRLAACGQAGGGAGEPGLVRRGPDPLVRLASLHPQAEIWVDDASLLARLRAGAAAASLGHAAGERLVSPQQAARHGEVGEEPGLQPPRANRGHAGKQLAERLHLCARAFDDALEAEIDGLAETEIPLPGGLRATVTPTPALTAIDVDGGASTALRGEKPTVQFAANRAALPELVRHMRLRNLSGAILVDLAGLAAKRRAALAPELAACLATDPTRPRLLGFTRLGLAEILRPRHAAPLHEVLAGPLAAGLAALRLAATEPGRRARLRAAPAVAHALQADPAALADLARRCTYPLILQADPGLHACAWIIEDAR